MTSVEDRDSGGSGLAAEEDFTDATGFVFGFLCERFGDGLPCAEPADLVGGQRRGVESVGDGGGITDFLPRNIESMSI